MHESNLKKNTVFNLIKTLSVIVFPLITFPYVSRVLQPENIGKINFSKSIVSYIALIASLGISTYAIKECPKERDNKNELDNLASEIYTLNIFTTIAAYLVLAITLLFSSKIRNYSELILFQSITILASTLGADWVNTAMEDLKYITIRTFAFQFLSLIAMFLFVRTSDDYFIYVIITVFSSSAANFVNFFYRRKYCKTRIIFSKRIFSHLKPILTLFVLMLSQTLFTNIDITIIGVFKDDTSVGIYSTAVRIYYIISMGITSIINVVIQRLSYSYAKDDFDAVKRTNRFALSYIVGVGFPVVAGVIMLAPEIIAFIGGESYMGAVPVLIIFMISMIIVMFGGGYLGNIIMLPSGRENLFTKAYVIAVVENTVLNMIFIPIFGFVAAAVTTLLAEFTILIFLFISNKADFALDCKLIDIIKLPIIEAIFIVMFCSILRLFIKDMVIYSAISIVVCASAYMVILAVGKNDFYKDFLSPVLLRFKKVINRNEN